MKLVIATPLYPPELGGPATYSAALESGLSKRGIEVELVKFCDVRHLPRVVRHFVYFTRVWRALARADAVLALDPVSTGLPACAAAWIRRKPFVVKIVGDYAWEQGRQRFGIDMSLDVFVKTKRVPYAVWFLRRIQTGVARRASVVIVPSEYLKNIVVLWGISADKVRVIYNATSRETLGTVPEAVVALPRPLVVTAGRLVSWKHIDGVIDAVAGLRKDGIIATLAVVGDGPEHVPLAAHAKNVLGNDCVFTGAISHRDLFAVLAHADVFVLNSSYEGLSHILIEALSLGVPSVATRAGGNSEIITDGEDGVLISVADTTALTTALSRVLSDEEFGARLSARATASTKRFSIDAMLKETATVFATLITTP